MRWPYLPELWRQEFQKGIQILLGEQLSIDEAYTTALYVRLRHGWLALIQPRPQLVQFTRHLRLYERDLRYWTVPLVEYKTVLVDEETRTLRFNKYANPYRSSRDGPWNRARLNLDLFEIMTLLVGRLRCCRHCERFFIRIGRQRYCSVLCGTTVRVKAFRKRKQKASSK